jgi:hypothetical protein
VAKNAFGTDKSYERAERVNAGSARPCGHGKFVSAQPAGSLTFAQRAACPGGWPAAARVSGWLVELAAAAKKVQRFFGARD